MKKNYLMKLLLSCIFLMTTIVASAQTGSISGKVVDESNLPLPGASVSIKGTSKSTATDVNGNYKLSALNAGNITLTVSFMGYVVLEKAVEIGSSPTIQNFKLQPSSQNLSEVIVVGYGTQTRREVTGSIAKVNAAKIVSLPTPSFEASLQGRAAGVQVIQGSGLAGSGSVVRIRGIGSISAGGDPLYVIDGIPINQDQFISGNRGAQNQNPLAAINPNDIESIEILKDAGSAGIYGSRGSNGVILITTKRGKSGKPSFSFSSKTGVQTPASKPNFVNGTEWLQLYQEAYENDGNTGRAPLPGGLTYAQASQNNTNWFDLVTRSGVVTDNNLSSSFGKDRFKGFVSANYSNNESFIKNNAYRRVGFRGNFDIVPVKNVKINLSQAWNQGRNDRVNNAWNGGLGAAMSVSLPIYPVNNADGSLYNPGGQYNEMGFANPLLAFDNTKWRTYDVKSLTSGAIDYTPIKNLTVRAQGNYDYTDRKEDQYVAGIIRGSEKGYSQRWRNYIKNYNYILTGNYSYSPNKDNKLSLLAGYEYQNNRNNGYNLGAEGIEEPFYNNEKAFSELYKASSGLGVGVPNKFVSYFSRLNYVFKDRYVVQGMFRADGSSNFGRNNRYGYFPTVSAAWIVSEEDFLKDSKVISSLKFRVGYGITGNASLPANEWRGTYSQPNSNYTYNGQPVIQPVRLENPNLKWETSNNFDAAVEYGFLNNRINGEISYFNRLSKDLIINRNNSPSTGFPSFWDNVGEVMNNGLEFTINSTNIKKKDFSWSTSFNIAAYYNEIKSLGDLTPDAAGGGTNDTRVAVGYPIGTNYLVRYYGVDAADGLPIWLDKNGLQTKTFDLDNRVPVGKVTPDAVGGLSNTFNYKGFELTSLFAFTIGGNIYDASAKRQLGIATWWNYRTDIADRWRQPGDQARFPRLTQQASNYPGLSSFWQYNSTMFLYDASYVRLRELTLGYTLPVKFANRIGMSNAKLYVTGMNLLTWTKYPGGDPEIARDFENAQDRNMSPNITFLTVPQAKSFTLGLNVNF